MTAGNGRPAGIPRIFFRPASVNPRWNRATTWAPGRVSITWNQPSYVWRRTVPYPFAASSSKVIRSPGIAVSTPSTSTARNPSSFTRTYPGPRNRHGVPV